MVLCYSYAAAGYQHRLPPCIQSKSLMKQFGLVFSFLSPALRGLRWAPPLHMVCGVREQLPALDAVTPITRFPGCFDFGTSSISPLGVRARICFLVLKTTKDNFYTVQKEEKKALNTSSLAPYEVSIIVNTDPRYVTVAAFSRSGPPCCTHWVVT